MKKRMLPALLVLGATGCGGGTSTPRTDTTVHTAATVATVTAPAPKPRPKRPHRIEYAVGLKVLKIVDRTRRIKLPNGATEPRPLTTYVRYPAVGAAGDGDHPNAPAAKSGGPYPLVIFGHGFNLTPDPYVALLRAWTRAGYVVAAPEFPLESSRAPGGANENDLFNQPRDMSVLITRLERPRSPFASLIDPAAVAVSGHSDGGDTALVVAYSQHHRDPRVRAAVILSGAKMPGVPGYATPPGSPPLLATQGTSDTINLPSDTDAFFGIASRPKFLLRLLGAPHLTPYTTQELQLSVIEKVTIAFLDRYLKGKRSAGRTLQRAGNVSGVAELVADQ